MNKVAILLPMYNESEYVNICIDSILRAKGSSDYRVFVMDDVSRIEESEKVSRFCNYLNNKINAPITYKLNEKNLGFSGNINKGLELAHSDIAYTHICLLNSDTLVTDFWLDDLIHNSSNALVSAVSNSVGNEQIIPIDYKPFGPNGYTLSQVKSFAKKWRDDHQYNTVGASMLGFFCVLGPRELFNNVGNFDENFKTGYYEDDDYCRRCLAAGFQLKIVRQVFIHHFGSQTFKNFSHEVVTDLFQKNKAYFISKHGSLPVDQSESRFKATAHEISWAVLQGKSNSQLAHLIESVITRNNPQKLVHLLQIKTDSMLGPYLPTIFIRVIKLLIRLIFNNPKERQKVINDIGIRIKKYINSKLISKILRRKSLVGKIDSEEIIVFFPIQSYFGRKQRPQHIFNNINKNNAVKIWIEPLIGNKNSTISRLSKISNNSYILYIENINYSNFYNSGLSSIEALSIDNTIKSYLDSSGVDSRKITYIFQSPFWGPIIQIDSNVKHVYDCMDLHTGFGSSTYEVEMLEEFILSNTPNIIVTSSYLYNYVSNYFKNVEAKNLCLIKNGCTPKDFPLLPLNKTSKKIGYFGAVAEWFDAELIIASALMLPNYEFEIIGEVTNLTFISSKLPPNILLLGEIPYDKLPIKTKDWLCGTIPFKITELIKATNPVKLYEYSALGLPVLSTPIPEVMNEDFKSYFATNANEFVLMIEQIALEDNENQRKKRREFALNNSWESRSSQLINHFNL